VTERVRRQPDAAIATRPAPPYEALLGGIAGLLEEARRTSARAVNALMTATYWEIGRRIVEHEQGGKARAEYGEALLKRLAADLTARFGRGFGVDNLQRFRLFYLAWPPREIYATLSRKSGGGDELAKSATPSRKSPMPDVRQTPSGKPAAANILQTPSGESGNQAIVPTLLGESRPLATLARAFPLPWSAYVRLLAVKNESARRFYETEALRGGWSVRQLDRQIQSQFYEHTALSRNKAAMLAKGARARPEDAVTPEEEVKDPYVLEFLGLKDEYSESDLEEALIRHLETFLLELGGDFCFAGRQKRLRIGDEWYRVDLVFYHRRLRCLVLIDLKLGRFTHADAGQMHTYLNYAAAHWMHPDENPPVGLILCAQRDETLARYALDNLPNKVLAAEYRTVLPDEKVIAAELAETRRMLEARRATQVRAVGRKRGTGKEGE
jgi:predicted nuclease of restriction endonuclease-like (RecB) superfamily